MQFAAAVVLAVALAACSPERPPLTATDLDIRKPLPGLRTSAGYLALKNNARDAITITRVTSPQFARIEMHESAIENGVSRMYPLPELILAPGQTISFEPGGKHLMLMQATDMSDTVVLEFHAGSTVVLTVETTFSKDSP